MKNSIKRCFSVVLSTALLSCTVLPSVSIQANAAQTKIEYVFSGKNADTAGYAEGTIKFTASSSGTYRLYWADDQKALEGYNRIAKFTPSSGETKSVSLGYHTAIPAGATKIIACTSGTNVSDAVAVYQIPAQKQLYSSSGKLLYTFSSFSDVHIDKGSLWYVDAETHLNQGLQYSADKGSDYIVISGDVVTNDSGPEKEWVQYQKLLSRSDFVNPVWESDGNHDLRQGVESGLKSFISGSGLDCTKETFDSGKSYYYMEEKNTGDVFIFMSLELNKSPHKANEFTDEQIAWASNLMQKYTAKGVNVFLVEHSPINGYGAGDRMSNPYYGGMLNPSDSATKKFQALLEKYPNVIWLSGHTHEDFEMNYNYSDENGKSAHMLHIPSLAGSTKANSSDTGLDRNGGKGFNSQAYFTEVYENEVVFYGVNVAEKYIYPKYSYIMESTRTSASPVNQNSDDIVMSGASVSASEKLKEVSGILSSYYTYASYDQYQSLKKLYYSYKAETNADKAVIAEFDKRINELKDIAEYTGMPKTYTLSDKYYFENTNNWSKVYAYAWSGGTSNASWPGVAMKKSGTSNNHDLYSIQFDYSGQYSNIIFTDGSSQTIDIGLAYYKNNAFRLNGSSGGKYKVSNFDISTGTEQTDYALLYYISGTHAWTDVDTYFALNEEGLYEYSFTAAKDCNISFSLYDKTNKKYKSLAESAIFTYEKSKLYEYQLETMSSRGKSFTLKTMTAGDSFTILYNPKTGIIRVETEALPEVELINTSEVSALQADKGDTLYLTGSAEGGTAPYTYAYYYRIAGQTDWQVIGTEFSSEYLESLMLTQAGTYEIKVVVKDANEKTAEKVYNVAVADNNPLENYSFINSDVVQVGDKVRIVASGSGGTAPYTYAYYFKRSVNKSWKTLGTEYGTNANVTFSPTAAAEYDVKVIVKDSNGQKAEKRFVINAVEDLGLTNVSTVSRTNIKLGSSIPIYGKAVGGAGSFKYAFYFKRATNTNWKVLGEKFGSSTTARLKPTATGNYDIRVLVKDAAGTIVEKRFTATVV